MVDFFQELSLYCDVDIESLFLLLTMVLGDFSVLASMPYAVARASSLLVRSCSSVFVPPIKSMSSAKWRLQTCLPLMEMEVWWFSRVSSMILSRKRLNKTGERRHPLSDASICWEKLSHLAVQLYGAGGVVIQGFDDFDKLFIDIEFSQKMPETFMPDPIKSFLKVDEVVDKSF